MDNDTRFGFVASALISLGGIIGFVTKQSIPSLVAGGGSGALLAYGVRRQQADPRDVYLVVGVSAVLVVMMGLRFLRSRKFMPAGLVSLLSAILLYRFGQRLL
ncbi:hypothetical protein JCM10908_005403 [Rhodotorula pacifica]|uniref:TMEM14 family protein n=1 Tax=Rhodotorula pacifica TaxID=1495444 RepID=UPI00317B8B94